ncbi:arsenate reductase ArsC [Cellulomonas septica]|uniref:Arsenate reductase ArsC n=2 Tax=Cellulomonas septica TaxID=285080 RepID=A0ABX1JYZ4_9CELL|nr:arsenate reductase ArsC [Cellulomonas septica]
MGSGTSATYRPTHDALARFGALLGSESSAPVDPPPDVLRRVSDQLVIRFAGSLSAETVNRFVDESYELLASRATVRTHLPVLTARFAAERLEALADVRSARQHDGADVLFVCVHNAGRSQLAAAALRTRAGASVRVRTAGSVPASRIEHTVLEVIERRGWTPALEFPKPLTDEVVRASDYVITMGCGDACPVVPGRTYLDWRLDDPAGRPVDEVESIADEVDALVRGLVEQIRSSHHSGR